MKSNKKILCALMAALMLIMAGCSKQYYGGITQREDGDLDGYIKDILPESEDNAYGGKIDATLYFRYLTEPMMTGVEQTFTVTAEKTLEEMVVQALIDGPQDNQYEYGSLINPDTKLVGVKDQSGYLSITLSSEFLDSVDQDIESDAQRRRMAVQSIVNSITAIGNYSRVLLLIDQNNTGNGERLTYAEAGWDEYGERTIEPLQRDTAVILTPESVLDIVMQTIIEKDHDRLEYYLADRDYDGTACPSRAEFAEILNAKASIVSFSRTGSATISGDGEFAVVLVDITYVDSSGQPTELKALPVRMIKGDVWKASFQSLDTMFPEY